MEKIDFKKSLKELYSAPSEDFVLVEVPRLLFLMVDGKGDPNKAEDYRTGLNWVYSVSYALKFAGKEAFGKDYTVPPLEALWWSDDMGNFTAGRKDDWCWTQMLMVPDFITEAMFRDAVEKTRKKLGEPPSLRLEPFAEGLSAQILHIGSYGDEAPTIRRLHEEFIPQHGLAENGRHHEIYLSDPRRTETAKLRTILRQPVRRR